MIDIDGTISQKAESINRLRELAAQRGGQESEALGQLVLEDDARGIAQPANVEKLIALAEGTSDEPKPKAPWLFRR